MRAILIFFAAFAIAFAGRTQEDSLPPRAFRFEVIPVIPGYSFVSSTRSADMPYGAQYMYDANSNHAWNLDLIYPRMIIKDWIVVGARLSNRLVQTNRTDALNQMQAAYPQYYIERATNASQDHYQYFSGVASAGVHLHLKRYWYVEGLVDYQVSVSSIPNTSYAFRDKQSNTYFVNDYVSPHKTVGSFAFELNLIRYSNPEKPWRGLFYGINASAGTTRLDRSVSIIQSNYAGDFNTINYNLSKRMTCVNVGIFFGFRINSGRRGD